MADESHQCWRQRTIVDHRGAGSLLKLSVPIYDILYQEQQYGIEVRNVYNTLSVVDRMIRVNLRGV